MARSDDWGVWQRIIRDFVILGVGAFLLIYEAVAVSHPNPYIIAAGLGALGLPPALRFDIKVRRDNPDDDQDAGVDLEKWSHLP